MKTFFYFVVFALLGLTIASCGTDRQQPVGPGVSMTIQMDTIVPIDTVALGAMYQCGTGKVLPGKEKVLGHGTKNLQVSQQGTVFVPDERIQMSGYTYTGQPVMATPPAQNGVAYPDSPYPNKDISPEMSEILALILLIFLFLFLLLILGFVLWWLFKKSLVLSNSTIPPPPANPAIATTTPPAPPANGGQQGGNPPAPPAASPAIALSPDSITELLGKNGGSFTSYSEGGYELVVTPPVQTPTAKEA